MERLSFETTGNYSAIEAAIHVTRYALARTICQGKKILDIACGEGYGSRLLLNWGAAEVVGVDISADAIQSAKNNFSDDRLRYLCGDAQQVDKLLSGEIFDLIVSIETMEHVERPDKFLQALSPLRAANSSVLITCPNDWWYYPKPNESNRYHLRKYTQQEFITLVTKAIGSPDVIGLGFPHMGFINVQGPFFATCEENSSHTQLYMMRLVDHSGVLHVPAETGSIRADQASYFIAGWGPDCRVINGAALYPISMDTFASSIGQSNLAGKYQEAQAQVEQMEKEIEKMDGQLLELHREAQKYRIQAHALLYETEVMQEAIRQKDQLIQQKDQAITEKDQGIAEKDQMLVIQARHLEALLKRWNLVAAVPRKLVPAQMVSLVKKVLRSLRHVA